MKITNSNTLAKNPDDTGTAETTGPLIVDLGKQPRRRVKRLLRGEGKLMDEVRDCIAELRRTDKISAAAEPVIIVVRQKESKNRVRWPF